MRTQLVLLTLLAGCSGATKTTPTAPESAPATTEAPAPPDQPTPALTLPPPGSEHTAPADEACIEACMQQRAMEARDPAAIQRDCQVACATATTDEPIDIDPIQLPALLGKYVRATGVVVKRPYPLELGGNPTEGIGIQLDDSQAVVWLSWAEPHAYADSVGQSTSLLGILQNGETEGKRIFIPALKDPTESPK